MSVSTATSVPEVQTREANAVAGAVALLVGLSVGFGVFSLTDDLVAAQCFGVAAGAVPGSIIMMIWANGGRRRVE